jgi:uncharacterized protein
MTSILTEHRAEIAALCRRYHARRLEVFGSATSSQRLRPESDLDFLVEFEPLPPGRYADAYFGLMEALESLAQRPVDLIIASAVKNPYLRESIERTKTLLYAA